MFHTNLADSLANVTNELNGGTRHARISVDSRTEMIRLMNQRLASAIDLQMQMKQGHWNVKGPSYISLHKLFDEVYETAESSVDLIAERIVQLDGVAQGTVSASAAASQLTEYPHSIADGCAHVEAVACALSSFGHEVRDMIS